MKEKAETRKDKCAHSEDHAQTHKIFSCLGRQLKRLEEISGAGLCCQSGWRQDALGALASSHMLLPSVLLHATPKKRVVLIKDAALTQVPKSSLGFLKLSSAPRFFL